ncbi:hypothetical protein Lfu02_73760 [Longispora fulva]|nr:hypothetical protein Lfu02_73760 [Longispora fulva]
MIRLGLTVASAALAVVGFTPAAHATTLTAADTTTDAQAVALSVTKPSDVLDAIDTWQYGAPAIRGGQKPYQVAYTGLPAGLTKSGTGFKGYITSAGVHHVDVTVTDSAGATATVGFTVTALTDQPVRISSPPDPFDFGVGDVCQEMDIDFSGGTGTYTYAWKGLPPSLTYHPITATPFLGYLSGTLTRAGTYHPILTITDTQGHTGTWKPTFFVT